MNRAFHSRRPAHWKRSVCCMDSNRRAMTGGHPTTSGNGPILTESPATASDTLIVSSIARVLGDVKVMRSYRK